MNYNLRLISVFALLITLFACKNTRVAEYPKIKDNKKLEEKEAGVLENLIIQNTFKIKTASGRASVETNIGGNKTNFNISLRMQSDSVIWISISPLLGIEVARIIATRDSIQFMDRLNKRYSSSDYKYLNDLYNLNIDYDVMQGILTGNIFSYKKNKFNSAYIDDKYYILSTLSKNKLLRSLEEEDPSKPIIQDIWIDDESYKIIMLSIDDKKAAKKLLTEYSDFRTTDGGLFPYKSKTQIIANDTMVINLQFSKLNINESLSYPFSIPENYAKVQ